MALARQMFYTAFQEVRYTPVKVTFGPGGHFVVAVQAWTEGEVDGLHEPTTGRPVLSFMGHAGSDDLLVGFGAVSLHLKASTLLKAMDQIANMTGTRAEKE